MKPFAYEELPAEKFPVQISAFGGDGDLMWVRVVEPNLPVEIPGAGPGAVRYIVTMYGDGSGFLYDDPTYGGTR